MQPAWTRREIIAASGAAFWSLYLTGPAAAQTPPAPSRKRALRLAHLSDSHLQPERRGVEGYAACLQHVSALADKPELVLTGGDLIMDGYDATRERTKLQWDLYLKTLGDNWGGAVEHTLGNHDIWGWNKPKSGATGDEPDYGKRWACELLGYPKPYRSFDRGGWHFIVLDSVASDGGTGYIGRLEPDQFAWLEADLKATPADRPILVCSHIPIATVTYYAIDPDKADERKQIAVPAGWSHLDAPKLMQLFDAHPNVKLCLSGHIHQLERIDFRGVTYICDGAVSGAWWRGAHRGMPEGYGVVDLFDDGSFEHQYVTYGWKADAS